MMVLIPPRRPPGQWIMFGARPETWASVHSWSLAFVSWRLRRRAGWPPLCSRGHCLTTLRTVLNPDQRRHWDEDGFVVVPRLLDAPLVVALLDRAVQLCRLEAGGEPMPKGSFVAPEKNSWPGAREPEDFMSTSRSSPRSI